MLLFYAKPMEMKNGYMLYLYSCLVAETTEPAT